MNYINSDLFLVDEHQTPMWAKYMSTLGWKFFRNNGNFIYFRHIPILGNFARCSRPRYPTNYALLDSQIAHNNIKVLIMEPNVNIDLNGQISKSKTHELDLMKNGFFPSKRFRYCATKVAKLLFANTYSKTLKNISTNAKRNIEFARKRGIKTEMIEVKDIKSHKEIFEKFYTLYKQTSKMRSFFPLSRRELTNKMLAWRGNLVIGFCYLGDAEPIGAVMWGLNEGVAHYMNIGSSKIGYETKANYLLIDDMIRWGQSRGIRLIDFQLIFDERYPNDYPFAKRFSEFKNRFHPSIISYTTNYIKVSNKFLKWLYSI